MAETPAPVLEWEGSPRKSKSSRLASKLKSLPPQSASLSSTYGTASAPSSIPRPHKAAPSATLSPREPEHAPAAAAAAAAVPPFPARTVERKPVGGQAAPYARPEHPAGRDLAALPPPEVAATTAPAQELSAPVPSYLVSPRPTNGPGRAGVATEEARPVNGSGGTAVEAARWEQDAALEKGVVGRKKWLTRRTLIIIGIAVLVVALALGLGLGLGLGLHSGDSSSPSSSSSGGDDSSVSTATHHGDLTYYNPGLGACGVTSSDDDMIVAVSHALFDSYSTSSNPNLNPLCGLQISVWPAIESSADAITVTVVDRCTGCREYDLDLSPAAFGQLMSLDVGRAAGEWHFN